MEEVRMTKNDIAAKLTKNEAEMIENIIDAYWSVGTKDPVAAMCEAHSAISAIETVLLLAQERTLKEGDGWTVTPNDTSAVTAVNSSTK